jgi:16S rRNA (adenine1518-N6/adenine1519-N6)-dimethyltransferase
MFPKKSFSQNFLRDESVIERIAREGSVDSFDWIVEIGAGGGALTEKLAERAKNVIALEFDHDLIPGLLKKFPLSSNVSIIETDILRTDIPKLLAQKGFQLQSRESRKSSESRSESWSVFGNIPYAITGKIIRLLVALDPAPDAIILMVQKEVAERIVAKDGKQSLLSLAVALFGASEILFSVSKDAFFPAPNVESAIIRITPNKNRLSNEERERILRLAKKGFASKRKTLANNFAAHREYSKAAIETFLARIGKNRNTRAEELSPEEWKIFQKSIPNAQKP